MKKHIVSLILLFACLALLCACRSEPVPFEVRQGGTVYTVDPGEKTISWDGIVCEYELSGRANSHEFQVTYPDGSYYRWKQWGSSGSASWSRDYDPEAYADGRMLFSLLPESERVYADAKPTGRYIGVAAILLVVGFLNLLAPRGMWYLCYGWRYKNVEPSDTALVVGRVGGGIAVLAGLILFFL